GGGRALPRLERERDGKGLERRTGLEKIGDDAVAQLGAAQLRAVVRVVRGHVRERQHFAAPRIEGDERARLCPMALHGCLERGKGDALDLAVERQREIDALLRLAD